MSATELDVPVLISSDQIRRREFVTIRRGYDPHQVRDYLDQLADQLDLMSSMLREARLEAEAAMRESAQPKVDPYERLAKRVASVIREADEVAERLHVEGRRDAERMLEEARADADRIRTDAQAKAEEARDNAERSLRMAKEHADRTLSGLSTRRQSLVGELAQMQERLLGVARELEATIVTPELEDADIVGADVESADAASAGGSVESPDTADDVVDVTSEGDAETPQRVNVFGEPIEEPDLLDDPSYEELWEGTQAFQLEMPEIPPLDLLWGDGPEDAPRD
jgi:DivIVA domain-containing protein